MFQTTKQIQTVVRVLCAEHMEAAHKIWCKQRAF